MRKITIPEKKHRQHGDASSIFERKFRNRICEQIDLEKMLNFKIAHAHNKNRNFQNYAYQKNTFC